MDVALLDRALVHYIAGNAKEAHLDVSRGSLLLRDLVQFEGEIPTQNIDAVSCGCIFACADGALELGRDLRHVADADRRIDGADVNHSLGFYTVQPSVAVDRPSVGKF